MRTNAREGAQQSPRSVNVNLKVMSIARAWAECVMLGISHASPHSHQDLPLRKLQQQRMRSLTQVRKQLVRGRART